MAQSVRMSDVAQLAQVSTMTVSRVLNENASVLEETRQRVYAAIEQLGYRRNELARSLRERRSRQIGIVVPNLYDSFFSLCAHAISTVAKRHNYAVSIATTDEDLEAENEEFSRMALRNIAGLVVIPAPVETGESRALLPEMGEMPIVALDRPLEANGRHADTLLVENKRGTKTGTEHLLSLGHKRIAFVGLQGHLYTMRKRYAGYREAMKAAGLRANAVFVSPDREDIQTKVCALLQGRRMPTALFCANNLVMQGALHALKTLDLSSPEQIALVGFDDFEAASLMRPGITVVRQPVEAMARMAAEVLFSRLGEGEMEPHGRRIVLPVELIVRGSCGARA